MEESGSATGEKDNKQSKHTGCQGECLKPCIYPSCRTHYSLVHPSSMPLQLLTDRHTHGLNPIVIIIASKVVISLPLAHGVMRLWFCRLVSICTQHHCVRPPTRQGYTLPRQHHCVGETWTIFQGNTLFKTKLFRNTNSHAPNNARLRYTIVARY